MPTATDAELEEHLLRAPLRVLGRLVASSNQAVLMEADGAYAIHKPITLERPLWDYPPGTLARRERAAYLVCAGMGLSLVPPTVLREGPWGLGSLQLWIGEPGTPLPGVVTVCAQDEVPRGWLEVLRGHEEGGRAVCLAHADTPEVRSAVLLDAVLNNSDRKGGHLGIGPQGLRGFDHGVSLGSQPKLRTVLWGWAGDPLSDADLGHLETLTGALRGTGLADELGALLEPSEVDALNARIRRLRRTRRYPVPAPNWPAIPWPAM